MTLPSGCSHAQHTQRHDLPVSGFVDSDGLKIFFQRFGHGSPLILVHGWGADTRSNWVDNGWIDVLKEHRTVISIDVRGHGKSDKPHALDPYSYDAMSRDVLAVLDAHKIEQSDFMGYSMGSFMGAYLLGHHPERFTSMILGGIGDETDLSASQGAVIAQALRAPSMSSVTDPVGKAVRMYVESNPDNDLEALAYSALRMWPDGYPLRVAGPNIEAALFPVLIVNGEEDHPYVETADHFANALPNGKHIRIPGVDHLTAVPDERFKNAVIDFLKSL
jgi:pimeloyl-ACP methyl ester carboxylesterase